MWVVGGRGIVLGRGSGGCLFVRVGIGLRLVRGGS